MRQGSVYVSLPDSGKQHHASVHITDNAQQDVLWQAMQSSHGPGMLAGTVSQHCLLARTASRPTDVYLFHSMPTLAARLPVRLHVHFCDITKGMSMGG